MQRFYKIFLLLYFIFAMKITPFQKLLKNNFSMFQKIIIICHPCQLIPMEGNWLELLNGVDRTRGLYELLTRET